MAARTHYQILGVAPDASAETIRDAYRRRAREHHPDRSRSSAAGSGVAMPEVNEAYRVLRDPGRRAVYDAGLRAPAPGVELSGPSGFADGPTEYTWPSAAAERAQPARVPWRGLLFCGVAASIGIIALAQFTGPPRDPGPDGILRAGDCVQIEPNNDAREVACSGEGDLVVVDVVPFDQTCPGASVLHRDRQGMGNACVDVP